MSADLKKPKNQAHLETCLFEKIVTHLERELELNGWEASDELQLNTVGQYATKNSEKAKPTCNHCNKPGDYKN